MSTVAKTLLTPQEYLARERLAGIRSEFYRGEMFAMAGASWEHTLIKDNLARQARNQLERGPCRVLTSDLRVKVNATGLYTYPDIVVVCDEPQFEDNQFDTLLYPRVVVEVLSDSTENVCPPDLDSAELLAYRMTKGSGLIPGCRTSRR